MGHGREEGESQVRGYLLVTDVQAPKGVLVVGLLVNHGCLSTMVACQPTLYSLSMVHVLQYCFSHNVSSLLLCANLFSSPMLFQVLQCRHFYNFSTWYVCTWYTSTFFFDPLLFEALSLRMYATIGRHGRLVLIVSSFWRNLL